MRNLYRSTSWRRVLALVLVFVMMFSVMGTSGYSVFAEGLEETGEAVVEPAAEEPAQEEEFTPQGESPGEEEAEAVVETEEGEVEVEAVEEAEEEAEEPAEEAVEEAVEDEEAEEPAEEDAEPVEASEEGEELEAEPAEEAEEEAEDPAEEAVEEEGEEEDTLIAEAAQIIEEDDGAEAPEAEAEEAEAVEEAGEEELLEEEAPEQEIAMPAIEKTAEFDGASVYVYAPEGAYAEGTTLEIKEVRLGRTQVAAVAGVVEDEIVDYVAYDITFYNADGSEAPAPAVSVTVNIEPKQMEEAENLQVVHIDGAKTESIDSEVTGEGVVFDAEHFSVYVVVATGEDARLAVNFVQADGTTTVTMLINQRQIGLIEKYIYDPGVGTYPEEGMIFDGWTDVQDYTSETTPKTIADIRSEVITKLNGGVSDGDEITYYAMVFTPYTIIYNDERNVLVKTDVVLVRSGQTVPEYTVSLDYTPYPAEQEGVAAEFMGWQQLVPEVSGEMKLYQVGDKITLNTSQFILKAYTEEGHWLSFDENLSNATYTGPQFVEIGENPSRPANPTRAGYTFDGWYTADASSARDGQVSGDLFNFNTPLTASITVYAKWNRATEADYTVIVWLENLNGDGYDFSGTSITVANAAVGVNTYEIEARNNNNDRTRFARVHTGSGNNNYRDLDGFTGFHLASFDAQKPVAAEGNTIINVYYDRNEYTLTFRTSRTGTVIYTIEALYQQSISSHFPIVGTNGITYNQGQRWRPTTNTPYNDVIIMLDTMPAYDVTFYVDTYNTDTVRMRYYLEALEGAQADKQYDGYNYTLYNTIYAKLGYLQKNLDWLDLNGFGKRTSDPQFGNSNTAQLQHGDLHREYDSTQNAYVYYIDFYYSRNQYNIIYNDGVFQNGAGSPVEGVVKRMPIQRDTGVYYEANIEDKNITPTLDGFVFLGWYDNEACAGDPYVFGTMPSANVTLYAKWGLSEYTINLHANASSDDPIVYNSATQQEQFWVDNGEKIGNVGGTRNYWDLIGWYYDEAMKHPFDFDAYVINNQTIGAIGTLYTPSQIDPEYPTTIGELNLYAKWRSKLVGAKGISIEYDPAEGINAPEDKNYYVDRAEALAGAASTPNNTDLVFSHWAVQKWNGSEYEDSGVNVFPGDTYEVLVENARITMTADDGTTIDVDPDGLSSDNDYVYTVRLTANYVEKDKAIPTFINWYNNYDGGLVAKNEKIAINEAVSIPEAPTRDGYVFKGWIRGIEENGTTTTLTDLWLTYKEDGKYYDENNKVATQVAADENLVGNGSQHHALYAKWEAISYKVTFDKNAEDASGTMADEIFEYDESKALTSNAFTRTNYNFTGWKDEDGNAYQDGQTVSNLTTEADGVVTLYAQWEIKTAGYTVKYYLQEEAGSEVFTLNEDLTDNETGSVGETASVAQPKAIEGYAFDEDNTNNVTSGTIAADGSLVLKLYYKVDAIGDGTEEPNDIPDDEDEYTIKFVDYDDTQLSSKKYAWGTPADEIEKPTATRQGYVFKAWDPTVEKVTKSATYKATYEPSANTAYKITYYLQEEAGSEVFTLNDELTDNETGTTGETASVAQPKTIEGYAFDEDNTNNVTSGTIAADGSLVLKLYYKVDAIGDGTEEPNDIPDDEDEYTIKFVDYDDTQLSSKKYAWGTPADEIEKPTATRQGYVFKAWDPTVEKVTKSATYKATYEPSTNTAYKITYYLQEEVGSDVFTLNDELTDNETGTTGETASVAQPKAIEGYAFDEDNANNVTSGTIAADGSLVLKLYYKVDDIGDIDDPNGPDEPNDIPDDEDEYTIIFVDYDDTQLSSKKYAWGTPADEIEKPTATRQGYVFKAWDPTVEKVTKSATYKATYDASDNTAYKITYYLQEEAGSAEFTLSEDLTETKTGTTGETASVEQPKAIEGYVFDEDNANNVTSGTIAADGSFALKLYYKVDVISDKPNGPDDPDGPNDIPDDEDQYTIRFVDYDDTLISSAKYAWGTEPTMIAVPADPTREGYTFTGWDPAEIARVTGPATYKATYEQITYTIIYHANYESKVESEGDEVVTAEDVTMIVTFNDVMGANEQKFSKTSPWTNGNTTYTFNSWNTKADGSGTKFTPGAYDGTGAVAETAQQPVTNDGTASAVSTSARTLRAMIATTSKGGTLELWAQWDEYTPTPGNPSRPPKDEPADEPDEEIPEDDTPLAPAEIEEEDEPEIDDGDTPYAGYEEEPDEEVAEEPTPFSPYTGDDRHTAAWGFVSLLSLAGIVVVARKRREE